MKRLFCLVLAVMLLAVGTSFAEVVYTRGPDSRLQISTSVNTASMTAHSSITTLNRILGFTYSDSAAGAAAIYDASLTDADAGTGLIGEVYVAAGGANTIMYPLPRNVSTSIYSKMTTSTGFVMIYYE